MSSPGGQWSSSLLGVSSTMKKAGSLTTLLVDVKVVRFRDPRLQFSLVSTPVRHNLWDKPLLNLTQQRLPRFSRDGLLRSPSFGGLGCLRGTGTGSEVYRLWVGNLDLPLTSLHPW